MNKHAGVLSAVAAAAVVGVAVSPPVATMASPPSARTSTAASHGCPTKALPLTGASVARAAHEARAEAPSLYNGFGPAVVELAWRAKFRLDVWASTPFSCSDTLRRRTVVVDLLFPKMLPSASLSEGVVLVSRFRSGYRVWEVGH
jgi:hypothetical protein